VNPFQEPLVTADVAPEDALLALLASFGLGLVVALVYRWSVPGRALSPPLQASLVLLPMVVAMVFMVVGNSVARAFGLVGALAIVRFRTPLRSPWDISFVFLSLAVGIACGVYAYSVAAIGTVVIGLAVLALHVLPLGTVRGEVHVLRVDVAAHQGGETTVAAVLDKHASQRWLLEARSLRFGETLSYRWRVVLKDGAGVEKLLREVGDVEGVERVVFGMGEEGEGEES
jgi:uncharacterized membrane protein YhiD involved in acid resistance